MNQIIGGAMLASLLTSNALFSVQPVVSPSITIETTQGGSISIKDTDKDDEILWLARALYSETKDEYEMRLVGWVIRNRVEGQFLGDTTYKDVVTHKNQFSGLNNYDKQFAHNISRTYEHTHAAWQKALDIAEEVYNASNKKRPIAKNVIYFYSPNVVRKPAWALDKNLALTTHGSNGLARFAFYYEPKI
jgi:hypothetical protein